MAIHTLFSHLSLREYAPSWWLRAIWSAGHLLPVQNWLPDTTAFHAASPEKGASPARACAYLLFPVLEGDGGPETHKPCQVVFVEVRATPLTKQWVL